MPDSPRVDSVEVMNEHLARFFEHADSLLDEWKAYGSALRTTIDAEAARLQETVRAAMETAGREAAANIDMGPAIGDSVARVRREIEKLALATGHLARGRGWNRARFGPPAVFAGLLLANLLLAVLIVLVIWSARQSQPRASGPAVPAHARTVPGQTGEPDAGTPAARPEVEALCTALAASPTEEELRELVDRCATSLCGEQATAVKRAVSGRIDLRPPEQVREEATTEPSAKKRVKGSKRKMAPEEPPKANRPAREGGGK